jgi:integrase
VGKSKSKGTSVKAKLTKHLADNAIPAVDAKGKARQKLYWDTTLPGFALCVGKTGTKTFVVQRRVAGKSVRFAIDGYGTLTVDQARTEAMGHLKLMREGHNPVAARREARKQAQVEEDRGITLREAWKLKKRTLISLRKSPKTLARYEHCLEHYLSAWWDRPLAEITGKEAERRHQQLADEVVRGKYAQRETKSGRKYKLKPEKRTGLDTANDVFRTFRTVYNRAVQQHPDDLPPNPCNNVSWFKIERERTAIPRDKLPQWYDGVSKIANPVRRDYLRLALFTGLRRESMELMRWEHVKWDQRVLHVAITKNNKPFDLPLTQHLLDLLAARRAENDQLARQQMLPPDEGWVFPAWGASGHIEEPREKIDGVPATIHDLRRTFVTVAESLDISQYALQALVNHRQPRGDVTAGYIRHDVERLRAPMQQVSDALLVIVEGPAPENKVVPMRKKRA